MFHGDSFPRDFGKPPLDLVEPRNTGWRKVYVITRFELSRFAAGAFQKHFGLSRGCMTGEPAVASQQNGQ
jgi:hypothetical protein